MATKDKTGKRQKEDEALNRLLLWFGGMILMELFVLLMNRFYINFDLANAQSVHVLGNVILALVWVGGVLGVAACAWLVQRRMAGDKTILPAVIMLASFGVAACSFITLQWKGAGVKVLYTLIPAAAVLALVYYLYQREFFAVALVSGGTLLSTWNLWKAEGDPGAVEYTICAVVAILALTVTIFSVILQKHEGIIVVREKLKRVLPKKASYPCIYITCGLSALILIAGLLLGATAAYAAIFVIVAWIFIMAVYYTVRLM